MGRHPALGNAVHRLGTDLKFDGIAVRPDQRGVQRLVTIGLGDGDVVLELARHGLVQTVKHAQRPVAVEHIGHQHAKAENVLNMRKAQVLAAHLAVDGIQRFFAAEQLRGHLRLVQCRLRSRQNLFHQTVPVATRSQHGARQHGVAVGVAVGKAQVLKFAVNEIEPETVRDGRVNVHRLARNAHALARGHRPQSAHIVETIGELDEDDANIARHRQQHFAKALRLVFLAVGELQFVELGQPIHQIGHGAAEMLDEFGLGDALVFCGVVKQRGHDGLGVELPVGAELGNRHGMRNVGLAAGAVLPEMRRIGEAVSLADSLQIGFGEVGLKFVEQTGQTHADVPGCSRLIASRDRRRLGLGRGIFRPRARSLNCGNLIRSRHSQIRDRGFRIGRGGVAAGHVEIRWVLF